METPTRQVARPGDADLDIDVDGITVRSFVRDGGDFIVVAEGGSGWWISGGKVAQVPTVGEVQLAFGFKMRPGHEGVLDDIAGWLDRWALAGTPLRLVGARGKMAALIDRHGPALPIPRNSSAG